MTARRPDLVECWVFRVPPGTGEPEFLLVRRAPDRIYPGLWQCVTGRIEPGERVPLAALREVGEEVGFGPGAIEAFFDLDQSSTFYDEGDDGLISAAIFAVRVAPGAEPVRSVEHDDHRWVDADEAGRLAVWPTYGESIDRVRRRLLEPDLARWFELDLDGHRLAR